MERNDLAEALGSADPILGEITPPDNVDGDGGNTPANPKGDTAPGPLAEVTLDQIRADPRLGPEFQSLVDKTTAAQLRGKTAAVRAELLPELRQQAEDEILSRYFGTMSDEDKAQVLTQSPELAATYARLQLQAQSAPDPQEDLERQAIVHGLARQIRQVHQRLIDSDLTPEVKASLDPNVFLADKSGDEAITTWTAAIDQAVVNQMLDKNKQTILSTEFEAWKQEQLAKEDESRPSALLGSGTRASPLPDLMANDSSVLLEQALSQGRK